MCRYLVLLATLPIHLLVTPAFCGESADNRLAKTWSYEGTSGYRSYDVREYSLGVTRFDNLSTSMGGTSIILSRLWTNRVYFGNRNLWKLDGHALTGSYRKFLGNSFFVESSLLAEAFRAWAPAYTQVESHREENYGNLQRLAISIQCGNQWQWKNLNIGITWLGKIVPISHKGDAGEATGSGSLHAYLTSPSNLGVRFSIGWAL